MWRSPHDQGVDSSLKTKRRALAVAILLSLFAFILQIFGSIYTGSLALLGDTAHVFTDTISLAMSFLAVVLAARPLTSMRSFGLFRLEVLASFLNGILLFFVAAGIAWEAVERLQAPQPIPAVPLLVYAAVGLLFNLLSALVLFRSMQDHSHHDHNHHRHHDHSDRNLRSAMLHLLSDALGSVAVIVGAAIMHYTEILWIDAAIGLLLAVIIAAWSVRVVGEAGHVLLEGTPKHIKIAALEKTLVSDPRVRRFGDLHVWEITSRMYALSVDLHVSDMSLGEADTLRASLENKLHEDFGIAHTAIVVKRASS